MSDLYDLLLSGMGSLKNASEEFSSMDDYISGNRIKVASMDDLLGFIRIGTDTLVHKAEKDLWRITEANGSVVIERLFDPSTNQPIRV